MSGFLERVAALPSLGIGVSTEYGAANTAGSLDVMRLRREYPEFAGFLEVGVEVAKGLDDDCKAWIDAGLPTTYHFLDVNLDDPDDFDREWLDRLTALAQEIQPAWMCGDAGLWHLGRRDRGHMLLLPPILSESSADAMADGVTRLREETGFEVLPENPPGTVFVGDMHLLDYFARVADRADTGLLLDCAHLAIYQKMTGNQPLTALDGFPLERIVELHVAGGTVAETSGFTWVEDNHTAVVGDETWEVFDAVVGRCPNLKAVVFECERNTLDATIPGFQRIAGAAGIGPR